MVEVGALRYRVKKVDIVCRQMAPPAKQSAGEGGSRDGCWIGCGGFFHASGSVLGVKGSLLVIYVGVVGGSRPAFRGRGKVN